MKFVICDELFDCPYCPIEDDACFYYNYSSGCCMMEVIEGCPPYTQCDAFYTKDKDEEDK